MADAETDGPLRIVLDCDPGIDDALAILFLASRPNLTIVAAGSVHGNVPAPLAALNALRVLEIADRNDTPVAVGAARPLAQALATGEIVHGLDGLGNVGLPEPRGRPTDEPAAAQLVRLARAHPGELTLLALGPITNLAIALLLEPELPRLIRRVVVMGGAVYHRGNITLDAEANIWHDPEAAEMVLTAGWPLTLVGLDVTSQVALEGERLQALEQASSPWARFAWSILQHYLDFYASYYGRGRLCLMHDPLAAAIAVDPSYARYRAMPLQVELRGTLTRGATRGPQPLNPNDTPRPSIDVAIEVDATRFLDDFVAALIDHGHQSSGPA